MLIVHYNACEWVLKLLGPSNSLSLSLVILVLIEMTTYKVLGSAVLTKLLQQMRKRRSCMDVSNTYVPYS